MQGLQNPRERCSFISFAGDPGNLVNEMMPWRQRGHGMDPGGPNDSEGLLVVEHKYRAHLTHSSCLQPEIIPRC